MTDIVNFDPNLNCSGNMSDKTIKLTFGLWEYRAERTVTVGGNCSGVENISSALIQAYDEVCEDGLVLVNNDMDTLVTEDDENKEEDWLGEMLIKFEVLSVEPQKTVNSGES